MKPIRALIVEDEPLARSRLRRLVLDEADLTLMGECGDGTTALKAIRQHRPELVFLDVRLPGLSGLELLKALDGERPPAVIFVTAHDRYALPAFASGAVDFLLKPFTRDRFRESLQRARLRLWSQPPAKQERAADVLGLKVGRRFVLIPTDEIEAVVAGRSCSVLHTAAAHHRTRLSLAVLEKKLPPGKYVRINRSTLVNAARIKEVVPKDHGDGLLRLENGRTFALSRRYRAHWSALLGAA